MSKTKATPLAKDFMTKHVHTVAPDMPLADVVSCLLKHKISNVPVVEKKDGGEILIGFVSEGDCLEFLSNELFYGNPSPPQTARTIMKRHPVCVTPDTNLFALASVFVNHRLRHLPVVEDQNLVGIVSRRDILKATDDYYRNLMKQRDKDRERPDIREIMYHRFMVSD